MYPNKPSKWRQRKQRQAAVAAKKRAHGDAIRQLWADSAEVLPKYEAPAEGRARVPEPLRVDKPEAEVLVEAAPSQRAWMRQKRRDARANRKRQENARRREARKVAAATPQPSRRERLLAERAEAERPERAA